MIEELLDQYTVQIFFCLCVDVRTTHTRVFCTCADSLSLFIDETFPCIHLIDSAYLIGT